MKWERRRYRFGLKVGEIPRERKNLIEQCFLKVEPKKQVDD